MFIFFFKQKTAYEMRISDWSSDVCSSDLQLLAAVVAALDPGIGHDVLLLHARIAQEQGVVERLAVPVVGPAALAVQLQEGLVQPAIPFAAARLGGLAALLDELQVELGEHQEQRVAEPGPEIGRA